MGNPCKSSHLFKLGKTCRKHNTTLSLCVTRSEPHIDNNYRMHLLWAFLFVSLAVAPGCSNLSTKEESIRNANEKLIHIAKITLMHIKMLQTELPGPPQIKLSTPSIQGLTSISHDLGLLANEVQSTGLLNQIHADVSSLEGLVRYVAGLMECPLQDRPQGPTGEVLFPHTQAHATLMKVQLYLDNFILHKDKLKVC
ncbi:leptin-B-like [Halichoeres trimaculatus]|uniref:leptin-B-like n=1 Tax=Halichoeres trimaculatus TaxID=147232 RepID=UPI003D9EBF17